MTTRPKPLLPETNNPTQTEATTAWYRSSTVWLGILLTLFILAGCVHFVMATRAYKLAPADNQVAPSKELTHLLGVPLSSKPKPTAASASETIANPQ